MACKLFSRLRKTPLIELFWIPPVLTGQHDAFGTENGSCLKKYWYESGLSILNTTDGKAERWVRRETSISFLIQWLWLTRSFPTLALQPFTFSRIQLPLGALPGYCAMASLPASSASLLISFLANVLTVESLICKEGTKWCSLHSDWNTGTVTLGLQVHWQSVLVLIQ